VKNQRPKSEISPKEKTSDADNKQFPIVGIGASAGGLEALENFLGNVPENSGMAYIVIQHLDPTQKGMLPELLQRISRMKVFQVKNLMAVKPNCVYVIPPNKSLSIEKGTLHLFEPMQSRGLRLPIDFFFNSLAADRKERSIGLILSGMGSDGSMGCRAIKEKKGIVMVQDPLTAKFDSMPRNAIEAVQVDIIAPADQLPAKLIEAIKPMFTPDLKTEIKTETKDIEDIEVKEESALDKILVLLRTHTGNDFALYKKNTLHRRIERRMGIHHFDKISAYVSFLHENPKEVDILFKELLIGVTHFFRDPLLWENLEATVLPNLISKHSAGSVLRAWIPACSTGEEAYSLAMAFKETIERNNLHEGLSLQIFATDLDHEAIETARKGLFPATIKSEVSASRINRFFSKSDEGYRVNTEIREMVVFAQHNIIMHPPFTKIDILSCRNLLIYLNAELQKKLLGLFYYCINPEGIMLLGSSETLGTLGHLFLPIDAKSKIYKRKGSSQLPELFDFPESFSRIQPSQIEKQKPVNATQNIQLLADQMLLQQFSPIGVLVNENGDIIYTSGRTGKYLEPSVGKANLNIFAMLREGLRNEFPAAFRKALLKRETVLLQHMKVISNNTAQAVSIHIHCIDKPEPLKGTVMIIFSDEPKDSNSPVNKKMKNLNNSKQSELEKELQDTREEMQNSLEEMQTSQEELKSTNEELQSTNEELQSTNEELTSSKEEMQSLNEELQTVNAELQSKVDEFSRVNNDMKNLLNSTDIATLFLDKELKIRRFTNQTTKIFKLIKTDVGRPFTDLVTELIYPELADNALEVLRTLILIQKQIPSKDGRWFSVRIMPYRTFDDRIDGLVITFINISDLKQLEVELHETNQVHHCLLNSSSDMIIQLSESWRILEFNPQAERFFEKKRDAVLNKNFIELFIPEKDRGKTKKELHKLYNEAAESKFNMKVMTEKAVSMVEWLIHVILNNSKEPSGIFLISKIKNHE
jgi:two-component system, chemotaxis family, CheB/CheR fusion protein